MSQESKVLGGCTDPERLAHLVREWFKKATIVLVGKCSIEYHGRAASQATSAKRLIIIKEDGTLLVHEGRGREPLNWQPKAHIVVNTENNKVVIRALRLHPRESLVVTIEGRVNYLISQLGKGRFSLEGSEESIARRIANNPSFIEDGATLISREVRTPHGRVDIVLRDKEGSLVLIEVKRSMADISAIYQLKRYVDYYTSLGIHAKGVIAAQSISPPAKKLLLKYGFRYVRVEP